MVADAVQEDDGTSILLFRHGERASQQPAIACRYFYVFHTGEGIF
jgi:hypothetical protein